MCILKTNICLYKVVLNMDQIPSLQISIPKGHKEFSSVFLFFFFTFYIFLCLFMQLILKLTFTCFVLFSQELLS